MKTKYALSLACLTLIIGGLVGVAYGRWKQGDIIAETAAGDLKIRQIPPHFPGLNDSYAYRCEVWSGGLLCKATTLHYADFTAHAGKCSITVIEPRRAVFDIDGYQIECADFSMRGDMHPNSAWKRLDH